MVLERQKEPQDVPRKEDMLMALMANHIFLSVDDLRLELK